MAGTDAERVLDLFERVPEDQAALYELLDPDVEWDTSHYPLLDFPERVHGRTAVRRFWTRYLGTWTDWQVDAIECQERGDHVYVLVRERGRGKGSGIELERTLAQLFTFSEGRVVRWQAFRTKREALAALEEHTAHRA